mgnify:CR=1 FL=1
MRKRDLERENNREKANFIYANSGIICTKIQNENFRQDTLNELQSLLLYNDSLENMKATMESLCNKSNFVNFYINNYFNSISIIFELCHQINESNLDLETKKKLRNKLRIYTRYFKVDEQDDLRKNNKFVKIKKQVLK